MIRGPAAIGLHPLVSGVFIPDSTGLPPNSESVINFQILTSEITGATRDDFTKYPRTPHLFGSKGTEEESFGIAVVQSLRATLRPRWHLWLWSLRDARRVLSGARNGWARLIASPVESRRWPAVLWHRNADVERHRGFAG